MKPLGAIVDSLVFGAGQLLHRRVLWIMVWPLLVAVALWLVVAVIAWTDTVVWLSGTLNDWIARATFFVEWDAGSFARVAAHVLLLLLLIPLVQVTALVILGVFAMPALVEHVVARAYTGLERRAGGSFTGSVWNSAAALGGLAGLALLSLPLWLVPLLWPILPLLILGWVNQRVLRYDALAEHADAAEMRAVFAAQRMNLYLFGVLLALAAYVPLLNIVAPVVFALAVVHYLLGALQAQRGGGGGAPPAAAPA